MKKKTIAKHILGLIGVGILWFIVNQILDSVLGTESWSEFKTDKTLRTPGNLRYGVGGKYEVKHSYDLWDTDIDDDGGLLLLGMLVGYIVIYWAVKTIWFDKDKD